MDTNSIVVAIIVAVIGLVGVGIGAAATFGGVVYAERQREGREREARMRERKRAGLRELRDATLAFDQASTELMIERMGEWNTMPAGQQVWKPQVPTGRSWLRWAASASVLGAAHAELEDRALAEQVMAYQSETAALITQGPASASEADFDAFGDRVDARADQGGGLMEAIGAAIRQAPT